MLGTISAFAYRHRETKLIAKLWILSLWFVWKQFLRQGCRTRNAILIPWSKSTRLCFVREQRVQFFPPIKHIVLPVGECGIGGMLTVHCRTNNGTHKRIVYVCMKGAKCSWPYKLVTTQLQMVNYAAWYLFLGLFVSLRKATISFVMSVRAVQLGSYWTDFHEIWYLSAFRKSVDRIEVALKSDKNNRYFPWRPIYILDNILLSSS